MIKAVISIGGKITLLLGLSRENTERLHQDMPIMVEVEKLGVRSVERIIVVAGETEEAIMQQMRQAMPAAFAAAERGGKFQDRRHDGAPRGRGDDHVGS